MRLDALMPIEKKRAQRYHCILHPIPANTRGRAPEPRDHIA